MNRESPERELEAMSASEAAAYWHALLLEGPMGQADAAALERWLAAAPAHREAFDRGAHALEIFDDHADAAHLRALRKSALLAGPRRSPRLSWQAVAASVLLAGLAGLAGVHLALQPHPERGADDEAIRPVADHYQTQVGERLEFVLADGTLVTLNTATEVRVEYSGDERVIRLERGQAFFDVARDAARPFSVVGNGTRVTAIGTAFEVRLEDDRFDVALISGSVVVRPPSAADGRPADVVTLTPGQRLVEAAGQPAELREMDARREMRWREGFIELDDEPLAAALAEVNRYTRAPIILADPRLEEFRISGLYRTGRPEGFLDAVSAVLPAGIVRDDGQILLVWAEDS